MTTPLFKNRLFWIDCLFFYSFLLVLLFLNSNYYHYYYIFSVSYPILFAVVSYMNTKDNWSLRLNLLRIPFIVLVSTTYLAYVQGWPGYHELHWHLVMDPIIFFLLFMLIELVRQKGTGRFVSIPLAVGSSLSTFGMMCIKQSFWNGKSIFWAGICLVVIAMLLSIWRMMRKEDDCLRYLLWGLFLLLYIWIINPLQGIPVEVIDAFLNLQ